MQIYILWKNGSGDVNGCPPEMVSLHWYEKNAIEKVPKEYYEYERTPFRKNVVKDYTYMFITENDIEP